MRKVLIANRGEIAVRIARACRDEGLTSVAVYAEPDLDALHVQVADEAYTLGGHTPADSYLDIEKIVEIARRADADAVHPGYGFLAENSAFAAAVEAAAMTWIGPPPVAIEALGDKVRARHIAQEVGAPQVPGTAEPVRGADEVVAFAEQHGLPVAIKAAYGGGGRGLKVARERDEIPDMFESAVREATAAFGRGECFVERYLDRPRHVETQCLADRHGNVAVISTRDCSLQRRHQKLVEEAPAPFLSAEQDRLLRESSKAILRAAGYVGAGTCEFLVGQDGTVSFLEVNTRLQVEHPVTEEVTGIDLVREQFRIAGGEPLGYDDPPLRGHSIEFRINAEDAGRGFLPAPGTLTGWRPPSGPGVRLDAGYELGQSVPQAFDSLIAKLIVTGRDRVEALARARRALAEFELAGMPTVLPFHRAVVDDPAYAPDDPARPFTVHTRWIETEFAGEIAPYDPADEPTPAGAGVGAAGTGSAGAAGDQTAGRERITVEVGGKRLEVVLPAGFGSASGADGAPYTAAGAETARGGDRRGGRGGRAPSGRSRPRRGTRAAGGDALVTPMQGTIVKVVAEDGTTVAAGDTIVVLEAMKMEQPLAAHKSGAVAGLAVDVGQTVLGGQVICEIKDA